MQGLIALDDQLPLRLQHQRIGTVFIHARHQYTGGLLKACAKCTHRAKRADPFLRADPVDDFDIRAVP